MTLTRIPTTFIADDTTIGLSPAVPRSARASAAERGCQNRRYPCAAPHRSAQRDCRSGLVRYVGHAARREHEGRHGSSLVGRTGALYGHSLGELSQKSSSRNDTTTNRTCKKALPQPVFISSCGACLRRAEDLPDPYQLRPSGHSVFHLGVGKQRCQLNPPEPLFIEKLSIGQTPAQISN